MKPDAADQVHTRAEFIRFVHDLAAANNKFENSRTNDYLEALAAWASEMDGFFANRGESTPDQPTWRLMAQMLAAARVYE